MERKGGRKPMLKSVALAIGFWIMLTSSQCQSVYIFLQWANWPPFDWANPSAPSPEWTDKWSKRFPLGGRTVPFKGLPSAEPLEFKVGRGTVRAWRVPREGAGQCVVLYLHGNGGNIATDHRVRLYKKLAALPLSCDVIALDYTAFGASDGRFTDEQTAVMDVLHVLQQLQEQDKEKLIIWGHCLGTAITASAMKLLVDFAPDFRAKGGTVTFPKGLILESPFETLSDAAVHVMSGYVPSFLLDAVKRWLPDFFSGNKFETVQNMPMVARVMKVAVLHGENDEVVPVKQGERVAKSAQRSPIHKFPRGHNNIVDDPSLVPLLSGIFEDWGLGTFYPKGTEEADGEQSCDAESGKCSE